ncbi:LOW QUALITY PROTEIN: NF-kappa-B inhibitor-like protein 1 [Macrochelys suwanniensis]
MAKATWTTGLGDRVVLDSAHPFYSGRLSMSPLDLLRKGEATLTLSALEQRDSGLYRCQISIHLRESGTGAGTELQVTGRNQSDTDKDPAPAGCSARELLYQVTIALGLLLILGLAATLLLKRRRATPIPVKVSLTPSPPPTHRPIPMASRRQRHLWRYVESGRHRRLRSLLTRHREVLDLDQPGGHKGRPALHYACAHRDPIAAQILLGHGANPALQDQRGDTALHHAARQAARKGKSVYKVLFATLQSHCPRAMGIRNRAGETPRVLGPMTEEQQPPEEPEESDGERARDWAWRQKLLGECHDEYQETWRYEEDFCTAHPDPEPYEEWAERMAREYRRKDRQGAGPGHQRAGPWPSGPPPTERRSPPARTSQRPLEEESCLYRERALTKKEELREAKRRRYQEGCARVFAPDATRPLLTGDIPWQPTGTVAEMAAVATLGTDPSDCGAYRRQLRQQQALWPDKFAQRCGGRLAEPDRCRVLATVTALSQELNRLAEAASKHDANKASLPCIEPGLLGSLPGSGRGVGSGGLEQGGWEPGLLGSLPGSGRGGVVRAGGAGSQDSWVLSPAGEGSGVTGAGAAPSPNSTPLCSTVPCPKNRAFPPPPPPPPAICFLLRKRLSAAVAHVFVRSVW